jgi:hypothetical protein
MSEALSTQCGWRAQVNRERDSSGSSYLLDCALSGVRDTSLDHARLLYSLREKRNR